MKYSKKNKKITEGKSKSRKSEKIKTCRQNFIKASENKEQGSLRMKDFMCQPGGASMQDGGKRNSAWREMSELE